LIITILVITTIVIISIFLVRFGSYYFDFMTPSGVGIIDSDHADFKLKIILDSQQLDLDAKNHPELLRINPYIFFDDDDWVHSIATGANLQMLMQSISMEFDDNCLVIRSEFNDIFDEPLRHSQYCDEGKTKLRMYNIGILKDFDIPSYVPTQYENLVLIYDDINNETRSFTKYHHEELLIDHDD